MRVLALIDHQRACDLMDVLAKAIDRHHALIRPVVIEMLSRMSEAQLQQVELAVEEDAHARRAYRELMDVLGVDLEPEEAS